MPMNVEGLVIGGGPAGLAAAAEAARYGVEVMLVDERKIVGPAAEVTMLTSSLAWGIFPGGIVGVVTPGESLDVAPGITIIATGAQDRLLPFPGWEHPSVVTAAEALELTCATSTRLRWIVAGIGEIGAQTVLALRELGHQVVAYVDVLGADGDVSGSMGALHDGSRQADFLCLACGRQPLNELAWLSGCAMEHRPDRGGYVPVLTDFVATSADGVLVAGDAAGLCGPETAALEGQLAGLVAAERTGRIARPEAAARRRALLEDVRAARERDQASLAAWVPMMWEAEDRYVRAALAQPDTLLCRCEQVTGRQVRAAVDDGALTPGDVKRSTRAGMGECQGRHCRPLIARAVSVLTGLTVHEASPLSFRPPVRPVPVAQLIT